MKNPTYLSDIESIELRKYIPELHCKKIEIITPPMKAPFGLEKFYEKLQLKLVFHNHIDDNVMRRFYNQIREVEKRLQILSSTNNYIFNIKKINGYEPLLSLRVKEDNQTLVKLLSNLKKNSILRCKFELQKQWNFNNRSGTIFNLIDVEIEEDNCVKII